MEKKTTGKTQSASNPYLNARREWDERYGDLLSRTQTWKLFSLVALGVGAIGILGAVYVGSQSKIQPFVVVTDQLGSPVAVAKPLSMSKQKTDQRVVIAQAANWIVNARSVIPDYQSQQVAVDKVYAMAGRDTAGFLNAYYKDNSPFPNDGSIARVSITNVIYQGGDTYQISWSESKSRPGAMAITEKWKSLITVGFDEKMAAKQDISIWNPLGIYVKTLNWSKEI